MIGTDFYSLCASAGVTNNNFAINHSNGTIMYNEGYPDDQKALIENVLASYAYDAVAEARKAAISTVNNLAGGICLSCVTDGYTQSKRYELKLAQAKAFLADASPTEDNYPCIYGEVGITADTATEVANTIVSKAAAIDAYYLEVELVRKKTIGKIESSTTEAAISSTMASISWPKAS